MRRIVLIAIGVAVLVLTGCEGPMGPAGPPGTRGDKGEDGATAHLIFHRQVVTSRAADAHYVPIPSDTGYDNNRDIVMVDIHLRDLNSGQTGWHPVSTLWVSGSGTYQSSFTTDMGGVTLWYFRGERARVRVWKTED
jgi:hypothetical protein